MLEVENLTKLYQLKPEIIGIENVSFKVAKKEIFALLGPNAAGKSTILKIVAGIIKPTKGYAKIDGYDIVKEPVEAKKRIGYLPEILGFYEEITAEKLLQFYASFYIQERVRRLERAELLLEKLGLKEVKARKLRTFSYGMRKRFALACALINEPQLLVMDEPTYGLDPQGIHSFRAIIKELNSKGTTILLASHILTEVQQLCNRVCILSAGKVIAVDSIDNLSAKIFKEGIVKIHIEVEDPISDVVLEKLRKLENVIEVKALPSALNINSKLNNSAEINEFLVKNSVKVKSLIVKELSLEEIFLKLTQT
ncbi:MAG: ABC transporter ATP-binding protein [Candidatus Thermoplasmatota archaeon]